MKTISFVVPCYNSEEYMDACIASLLPCGDDIEIIIINDGSTKDNTSGRAHEWETRFPNIVRAIDQENRGHGGAVNHGIELATGLYVKVVDSDDWLDGAAMKEVMALLRKQRNRDHAIDLVLTNYRYDKVHEGTHTTMSYEHALPVDWEFTWSDIGHFGPSRYILMHSAFFRTELIKDMGLKLPQHCFYVDNIFVYTPLPHVRSLYYLDVDAYHYFIGREDQSVNEQIMLSRIDQQIRITKQMIDDVDIEALDEPKLADYLYNYLSMMMCICSVFLRMEQTEENEAKRADIWSYLKTKRPGMYARVRGGVLGLAANLPSPAGRAICLGGYHIAQKLFKFN